MTETYWEHVLPLHPKLVHVPMALCVLMPLVAILIWVGVSRGWFTPRAWLIAAEATCETRSEDRFIAAPSRDES